MQLNPKTIYCGKLLFIVLFLFLLSACGKKPQIMQGYVEGKYTYITAAVSGTLDKLFVARGDQVKVNQVLFVLDKQPEASEYQAALQKLAQEQENLRDMEKGSRSTILNEIKARKAQALASLDYSKKTITRYRKLYKVGAIDKASVDEAEANYKSDFKKVKEIESNLAEAELGARENALKAQQAVVDTAKADVRSAKWSLQQKTQSAPIASLVFDTLFTVGEMVTSGQPVVSLLAPENVKVIFFVPEKLLSQVALNEKITFTCDSCPQNYQATISFISPEAEYTPPVIYSEASRAKLVYRIEAKLDLKTARLVHPGQPVQVTLTATAS